MDRSRVLIVDDEPALARALARSIKRHHDAIALTSGEEAIARIAAGERFDVILSDLMMPHVSGPDLYRRLLEIAPHQAERVVFLSGGVFTPEARAFLDGVPNRRIDKPCEPAALLAVIAEVSRRG